MTNEEAIKTIEVAIAEVEWNYPMDYAIAFETAISALEKQIPKKVTPHIVQPVEAPVKIGNGIGKNVLRFINARTVKSGYLRHISIVPIADRLWIGVIVNERICINFRLCYLYK